MLYVPLHYSESESLDLFMSSLMIQSFHYHELIFIKVSSLRDQLERLVFKAKLKLNYLLMFQRVINFDLVKMILELQVEDLEMHVYEIQYFGHFLPQTFCYQKYLLFKISPRENALLELTIKFSKVFLVSKLNAYFAFTKSRS